MKKLPLYLSIASSMFFVSCAGLSLPMFSKSPMYEQGEKDGCTTANGTYTKDSESFNNNADYKEGWFAGRSHCNTTQDTKQ